MDERPIEVVERKGRGHPDSICDALAEALSLAYSRHALERFGTIPHHNVDKVLLSAGRTAPCFGGGEVLEPIEITLAGRATRVVRGEPVPLDELAFESATAWLRRHVPGLDPARHVRLRCRIGAGATELVDLFGRGAPVPLANDTSIGCGHAPLSELERIVLDVAGELSQAAERGLAGAGPDVKVLGVRAGDHVALQIACAGRAPALPDAAAYRALRGEIARRAEACARRHTRRTLEVHVNSADDDERDVYYLTVTGTSAEMGDDGQAGRGNRANGLITPGRPMTLESVAGKNPTTHVGKLYNLAAGLLAQALVEELEPVSEAECLLVSRVGHPIDDPPLVDVRLRVAEASAAEAWTRAEAIVRRELRAIPGLWRELVEGRIALDRWPLRVAAC
jgi:S-adenosylmethionine synthetase